jgi:hypothetical protein
MAINMGKRALVMKHRNAPTFGPDENNVAIKDEVRTRSDEFTQALSAAKKRLAPGDRETIVDDEDDIARWNRPVSKDLVEQIHLRVDVGPAPVVLLPSWNSTAPDCSARQLCVVENGRWGDARASVCDVLTSFR